LCGRELRFSERAREWAGGSSAHKDLQDLPPKNLPSGKSSAFEFLNLYLEKRIVQETAPFPYAALRAARQKYAPNESSFIRATLYDQARTFFQLQSD